MAKETMKRKKEGSGKHCVVVGCKNNSKKLRKWKLTTCEMHAPETHEFCVCLQPYQMHRFPSCSNIDSTARRNQWVKNINRKDFNPSKYSTVCSIHFIEGRPTSSHPNPTIAMGYTPYTKLSSGRPTTTKRGSTATNAVQAKVPTEQKHGEGVGIERQDGVRSTVMQTEECEMRDASIEWYDATIADHCYARADPIIKTQSNIMQVSQFLINKIHRL